MKRSIVCLWMWAVAGVGPSCVDTRTAASTIALNPAITYQTFDGWEATLQSTVWDYKPILPAYDTVLDGAVNDLGLTRLQIGILAGTEHPRGYGQEYLDGRISEDTLVQRYAFDIVNDNSDPNVANLDGFDLTLLDWRIEHIVIPFKRRLEATGQRLYSYFGYVDFGNSRFEHYDHPDEYAELMLVLFDHMKNVYGFVPDGINVVNEPDQTPWTGQMMGRAIVKAGARLAAAGYHPDFIAPSTVDRSRAVQFFEDIAAVRGAMPFVKHLTYHCYADHGTDSVRRIGEAGIRYRVNTVMNECWDKGNSYRMLHQDLKVGRNSSWQQGPFTGPDGYYGVDATTMRVTLNPRTKIMRQYYRAIRPGAKRIDATTSDASFDPLAFINPDGSYVVIIKADAAGSTMINRLPGGTYHISYATEDAYDVHAQSVVVAPGQALTAAIPAGGVITVDGKRDRTVSAK